MTKVMVAYNHNPADFTPISLALTQRGARPAEESWRPAFRDTVDGRLVVWARFPNPDGVVWLRDSAGERQVVRVP